MVQGLFAGAPGAARGASLQGRKIPVGQWSTKTPGSTRLQGALRLQGNKTLVEQWGAKTSGSTRLQGARLQGSRLQWSSGVLGLQGAQDSREHRTPDGTGLQGAQRLQWSKTPGEQAPVEQWSTATPGGTRLQGAQRLQWSKTPGEQTPVEQWSAKRFGVGGAGAPLLPGRGGGGAGAGPARDEQLVAGNCWLFPQRGCRRSRSCSSGGGEADRSNLGRPAGGVAGAAPVVEEQLPTATVVGLWEEGQEPLKQWRRSY